MLERICAASSLCFSHESSLFVHSRCVDGSVSVYTQALHSLSQSSSMRWLCWTIDMDFTECARSVFKSYVSLRSSPSRICGGCV